MPAEVPTSVKGIRIRILDDDTYVVSANWERMVKHGDGPSYPKFEEKEYAYKSIDEMLMALKKDFLKPRLKGTDEEKSMLKTRK